MKKTVVTGLVAALLCTGAVAAPQAGSLEQIKARGELRVGLETGYMPFEMLDKSGEIVGFDVDLAKLMARKLGVKLKVVNQSWDGIIPALLTDKFDVLMGGMTITPERAKRVTFCDPYVRIGQTALVQKKSPLQHWKELDAPSMRVLSKLGTTGEIAAKKHFPRAQFKTFELEADAAIEVRNGRADAFIYDLPYNVVAAAQNPDSLRVLADKITDEDLGWAVRQGDPALRLWLNDFLAGLKQDGTYAALYRKWFESSAWLANVK